MTILLVQTFLLMLGAFLLGASLACLIRRAAAGREVTADPVASPKFSGAGVPAGAPPLAPETDRFGRALAGGAGSGVPPVFQGSGPVVEVQPKPAPVAPKIAAPTLAPLAPAPVVEKPAAAPAPSAKPEPMPEPIPDDASPAPPPPEKQPSAALLQATGTTYAEIAVAAAAAAAAAKAIADAEQAEAEKAAAEAAALEEEAASKLETSVASDPAPAAPPSEGTSDDDLTRIRAITSDLKGRLNKLGIMSFAEIAAWTDSDVARISQSLGFHGRIEQENWIEQALILAKGGDADLVTKRDPGMAAAMPAPLAADRLHRIIGIDPQSEALLIENGVTRIADIAAWTGTDIEKAESLLGQPGRVTNENWVEQAKFLVGGGALLASASARALAAEPPPAATPAPPPSPDPVPDATTAPDDVTARLPSPSRNEGYSGLRSVRSEALRGDGLGGLPAGGEVDDLKRIRGIGVLIEKKLLSLGVTSYEQVANWTGADIDRISQLLDFKGRIERENWIEQARILASGGQTDFSRRADRGEV